MNQPTIQLHQEKEFYTAPKLVAHEPLRELTADLVEYKAIDL